MIALLLLHASWVGLGLLGLRRLPGARSWPAPLALAAGYFAGALLHVLALHALLLTRLPALPVVWTLIGAGLLALPFALRGTRAAGSAPAPPPRRRTRVLLAALLLLPPAALIALQLLGLPDTSYDSAAFWNPKGAWLYHGVRLDDPLFTDAARVHTNPDYPLYRPIFAFEQYLLLGAADDHAAKPGFLLHLLAGLLLLHALLREQAGRTAALLALALLLWTPIIAARSIPGSPGTTYVDFPLGLQYAASVGFLLRALGTRAGADVAAAMVAAASAALMKNEGTIFCALVLTLGAAALLVAHGRAALALLAWLLLPAAVLLAWKRIQAGLAPQVYIRAPTPAMVLRLTEVAPRMAAAWWSSITDLPRWGALGATLVAGCAAGAARQLVAGLRGRERRARLARVLLALVVLGQFCAVLLGVMLLELQKGGLDNWMAHAWDRLILQLVPPALLLAVALNAEPAAPGGDAPGGEQPAGA